MDSHSITLVVVIIILVALSAFFSATETAFSSLNKIRIKNLAQDGNKRAKLVLKLSEDYDNLISTILIGNNIVNISSASIATVLFVKLFQEHGASISTIAMTIIVLIFGEVTPKSIAKEIPETFALTVAPVFRVLNTLFKPLNFLLVKFKALVSKVLNVQGSTGITEHELLTIVDEAEQDGGIDSNESELIRNVIEFNDLEAIDIHTPRIDVTAVDVNDSIESIADVFKDTGFSRLPVYTESIDSIIGVINEKDFHNYIYGTSNSIRSIMKPAEFIPPSAKISDLLKKLQHNKLHMAVIVDEFGGTEGIITLEDILEELVGEIWDEHDEIDAGIKNIGNGNYFVPASLELDEFIDMFDIEDKTDASTVNGWIIEHIDKIPQMGDSFDFDNLSIKVTKTEGQKALEVAVRVNYPKEKKEDDE